MFSSFAQSIKLLIIPFAEVVALRWFLHSVLGLRLGFVGFTDYDFILPMPLSFLIWFWTMNRVKPFRLGFSIPILILNLTLVLAFIGLNLLFDLRKFTPGFWSMGLWWILFVAIFASALSIGIGFRQFLSHPSKFSLVPALMICFSIVATQNWGGAVWPIISRAIESSWDLILPFKLLRSSSNLILVHPSLTLRIGLGCSGIDGLLFYMATFSLLWPLGSPFCLAKGRWLLVFAVGFFLQYVLNLLRIALLFVIGIFLIRYLGVKQGTSLLMNLFHLHLGYALYVTVMIPYLSWGLDIFRKRKNDASDQSVTGRAIFLRPDPQPLT